MNNCNFGVGEQMQGWFIALAYQIPSSHGISILHCLPVESSEIFLIPHWRKIIAL